MDKNIDPNLISVSILGIGVSTRITGIRRVFSLLRRGAHTAAKQVEKRLDPARE
jgi:hypothetical protein